MLQNPSKYHPNPLSHFLAFHNSTNLHQIHHHQQQQQQSHYPQNQLNESMPNGSLEANLTNTQLDVGKSFTIAAILGLQKNAIENSQKEFNSVMNLSINSNNNNQNTNSSNSFINGTNSSNSENNAIHMQNQHNQKSTNLSALHNALNVNGFNCDNMNSNIVNRYLPTPNGGGGGGTVSSNPNSNHLRMNNFGAVAAVAANGTPSALQSLQQLHQQHAQQTSIGFQARDKARIDNLTSKKSSLKSKRVRTIFTPEQLERLEAEFERQQYMVGPERLYLAHTLQLTEAQVKVWFQNRRIKWRKHHLEITQQRLALIRQRQISPNDSSANNRSDGGGGAGGGLSQLPNHLHRSESDLSICNDSMDTESIKDGEEV